MTVVELLILSSGERLLRVVTSERDQSPQSDVSRFNRFESWGVGELNLIVDKFNTQ